MGRATTNVAARWDRTLGRADRMPDANFSLSSRTPYSVRCLDVRYREWLAWWLGCVQSDVRPLSSVFDPFELHDMLAVAQLSYC